MRPSTAGSRIVRSLSMNPRLHWTQKLMVMLFWTLGIKFPPKVFLKNYLSIAFGKMSGTKRRRRNPILGVMMTITIISTVKMATVFVGGLAAEVDEPALRQHFAAAGSIRSVRLVMDKDWPGWHKGVGFVEYSGEAEASNAVATLHESELQGRWLRVKVAERATTGGGKGSESGKGRGGKGGGRGEKGGGIRDSTLEDPRASAPTIVAHREISQKLRELVDGLPAVEQRLIRLDSVEIFVLDEADQMLDIGFLPAIRRVFSLLPERRQTLLFSATAANLASRGM